MATECILQYGSQKVQYIGTKNISQYIVVTINRTITRNKKVKYLILFDFPFKSQRYIFKTHGNKVYWKQNVVLKQKRYKRKFKFTGC